MSICTQPTTTRAYPDAFLIDQSIPPSAYHPRYTPWDDAGPDTRRLWLEDADFKKPDFVARFRELAPVVEEIRYTCSKLRTLPEALRGCTRLRILQLNANKLQALPAWLGELTHLEELTLEGSEYNLWSEWPAELAALQRLRVLSLGNGSEEITSLSPVVSQLTQLQDLTLVGAMDAEWGCPPAAVVAVLGQLHNLRRLELPGPFTHELPAAIVALPRLHTLHFGWLACASVLGYSDDEFEDGFQDEPGDEFEDGFQKEPADVWCSLSQCASLRRLVIGGVYDQLPETIGTLTQLEHLELTGQFRQLPAAIWQLGGLRSLHLENQSMPSLPPAIGQLTQLQELRVTGALTTLPAELGQLQQLRVLNLSNNLLEFSPRGEGSVLGQLRQLQELNLAHNNLYTLPEALAGLQQLRVLDLGENALTALPPVVLQLRALEHLEINNNQLTDLPDALADLPRLGRLKYSYNQLNSLPPTLEARLRRGELELLVNHSLGRMSHEEAIKHPTTADLLADQPGGYDPMDMYTEDLIRQLTSPASAEEYLTALAQIAILDDIRNVCEPAPPHLQHVPELLLEPLRSPDGDTREQGIVQLLNIFYELEHTYNWPERGVYFPLCVPDEVAYLLEALHVDSQLFVAQSDWEEDLAAANL